MLTNAIKHKYNDIINFAFDKLRQMKINDASKQEIGLLLYYATKYKHDAICDYIKIYLDS